MLISSKLNVVGINLKNGHSRVRFYIGKKLCCSMGVPFKDGATYCNEHPNGAYGTQFGKLITRCIKKGATL